ncbi:fibroblast growth factor 17 isoform X3 [Paroedura picta]|uniref:fibroblast growth factor 17 isoform X3 n=1 Tax=Paroedura picta TaxID=143630 RepID=UPI004055EEDD
MAAGKSPAGAGRRGPPETLPARRSEGDRQARPVRGLARGRAGGLPAYPSTPNRLAGALRERLGSRLSSSAIDRVSGRWFLHAAFVYQKESQNGLQAPGDLQGGTSVECHAMEATFQVFSRSIDLCRLEMSNNPRGSPGPTWRLASLLEVRFWCSEGRDRSHQMFPAANSFLSNPALHVIIPMTLQLCFRSQDMKSQGGESIVS